MRRRAPEWVPAEALVAVTRLTPSCRKVGTTAAEGALAASSRPCRMAVRDKDDAIIATLVDGTAASSSNEARLLHRQQDHDIDKSNSDAATPSHNGMDKMVRAQPAQGGRSREKQRQQGTQKPPPSEKQTTKKRGGKDNSDARRVRWDRQAHLPMRAAHCCRTRHKRSADDARAKPRPACKHRCAPRGPEWPSRHGQVTNRASAVSPRVHDRHRRSASVPCGARNREDEETCAERGLGGGGREPACALDNAG